MTQIYSQLITVQVSDPEKFVALIEQWDRDQAATDIMGYMGTRILFDREHPGRIVVIADFGMVDPDVSAAEEAARNNDRPETQKMVVAITEILEGAPEYDNFDEVYRTDPITR